VKSDPSLQASHRVTRTPILDRRPNELSPKVTIEPWPDAR
jgi:hypothetical protein